MTTAWLSSESSPSSAASRPLLQVPHAQVFTGAHALPGHGVGTAGATKHGCGWGARTWEGWSGVIGSLAHVLCLPTPSLCRRVRQYAWHPPPLARRRAGGSEAGLAAGQLAHRGHGRGAAAGRLAAHRQEAQAGRHALQGGLGSCHWLLAPRPASIALLPFLAPAVQPPTAPHPRPARPLPLPCRSTATQPSSTACSTACWRPASLRGPPSAPCRASGAPSRRRSRRGERCGSWAGGGWGGGVAAWWAVGWVRGGWWGGWVVCCQPTPSPRAVWWWVKGAAAMQGSGAWSCSSPGIGTVVPGMHALPERPPSTPCHPPLAGRARRRLPCQL